MATPSNAPYKLAQRRAEVRKANRTYWALGYTPQEAAQIRAAKRELKRELHKANCTFRIGGRILPVLSGRW